MINCNGKCLVCGNELTRIYNQFSGMKTHYYICKNSPKMFEDIEDMTCDSHYTVSFYKGDSTFSSREMVIGKYLVSKGTNSFSILTKDTEYYSSGAIEISLFESLNSIKAIENYLLLS